MKIDRPQFDQEGIEAELELLRGKIFERLQEKGCGIYISDHESSGIITEEYHEMLQAVQDDAPVSVYYEMLDIAVGAILAMASFRKIEKIEREEEK